MKTLVKNNYGSIDLISGVVLGIGWSDGIVSVMVGCLAFSINTWMFKPQRNKPSKF
jgi:hypothetical protein